MINLMYVILMAMLALNVSSDVLNGFTVVDESLKKSTQNSDKVNQGIYGEFDSQMATNPAKTKEWYDKAQYVHSISDSLYNFIDELKTAIVKHTDGPEGDVNNIRKRDDLEASTQVMLAPGVGKGDELRKSIDSFREKIVAMVNDSAQRTIIRNNFSTEVPARGAQLGKNWQEYMFESMPTAAAVTLLSKLQSDIRNAEGEVLHSLIGNIDLKDIRVNQLNAYVIPSAQTVMQGSKFSAQIIMAAVDSTSKPTIFIGDKELTTEDGVYSTVCSKTGDFSFSGHIEMVNGDGERIRRDFMQKYSVIAPSATVSADIMNVLYAGYDNPISVSVPGIPSSKLRVSMTGGSFTQKGEGKFNARPTTPGTQAVISVSADCDGRMQDMGQFTFRVRALPDPMAFIEYKDGDGNTKRFRGGDLSKQILMNTDGLGAAIDDGLLNIPFKVQSFETIFYDAMGNAIPYKSDGANFSDKQKNQLRGLARNKRFYITEIQAIGPDGVLRKLDGAMQVIIK